MEQTTNLRCAAAFAIIAHWQGADDAEALEWPLLAERGRKFFVRVSAQLIDRTGMDRQTLAALMQREATGFSDRDAIDRIMPSCLLLLEASGI